MVSAPAVFFSSMQLTFASTRYIQKINLIICQACCFLLVHMVRFLINVGFSFQLFAVGTRVKTLFEFALEVCCYLHSAKLKCLIFSLKLSWIVPQEQNCHFYVFEYGRFSSLKLKEDIRSRGPKFIF